MHLSGWDLNKSVMSEETSCYEPLRPPPLITEQLQERAAVLDAKSLVDTQQRFPLSTTGACLDWSDKKPTVFRLQIQTVESMVNSEKCELCCIFIQSVKHAQDHIISKYHMEKLRFCVACSKNVDDVQNHMVSEEHRQYKESYCFICNIRTPTETQLSQHQNGSKHKKKNAELKAPKTDKDGSEYLTATENIIKSGKCFSCPDWTNLHSVQHVAMHLFSVKHLINSRYCVVCEENLPTVSSVDQHKSSERHKQNIKQCCLVCDVKGTSESQIKQHLKAPAHQKTMAELHQILTDRVVTEPPTSRSFTPLDAALILDYCGLDLTSCPSELQKLIGQNECLLCNAKLRQNDVKVHYAGTKHWKKMTQFLNTLKDPQNLVTPWTTTSSTLQKKLPQLSSDHDFPPLPKKDLSDTQAASVSNFLNFEKDVTVDSNANLDINTPMKYNLDKQFIQVVESHHNPNERSDNRILQDKLETSNIPSVKETANTLMISPDNEESSKDDLKEMVLSQLKKLVNSLYFSEEIPLDKALEYFKKFNKIIDDDRLKANKINEATKENVNFDLNQIEQQEKELEVLAKQPRKRKKNNLTNLNDFSETTTNSKKSVVKTRKIENVETDVDNVFSQNDCFNRETFAMKEVNIEDKNIYSLDESFQKVNETTTSLDKNINEKTTYNTEIKSEKIIQDFINQKISIFELADTNNPLEIEVLTELTSLVDSLYIRRKISIEQALSFLKSFNGEIEKLVEKLNSASKFPEFSTIFINGLWW